MDIKSACQVYYTTITQNLLPKGQEIKEIGTYFKLMAPLNVMGCWKISI